MVYAGIIEAHRRAIEATEEPDPVTQDMLIGHGGQLEQFHWFIRAHLEQPGGSLRTAGAAPSAPRPGAPAAERPGTRSGRHENAEKSGMRYGDKR